jgi:hypothetical protein
MNVGLGRARLLPSRFLAEARIGRSLALPYIATSIGAQR